MLLQKKLVYVIYLLAAATAVWYYTHVYAASMVYSFRMAQVTKQFQLDEEDANQKEEQEKSKDSTTLIGLAFEQIRKKPENVYRNYVGALGSLIYGHEHFYARLDTAFAYVKETQNKIVLYKGVQTDDILLSIGCNFFHNKKNLINLSGLAGFPTHEVFRLRHPDFGYGLFSAGCQLDGSYALSLDYHNIFMYGLRYTNFMPRSALDAEHKKYEFTIGNVFDIFLANKHHVDTHVFEYGYTTRFRFGPSLSPPVDDIVQRNKLIRNTFYFLYRYDFSVCDVKNKFLINVSYGFDSKPRLGNKYVLTLWASLNTTF